jgi:TetR/AcrR family transcriptional regulator
MKLTALMRRRNSYLREFRNAGSRAAMGKDRAVKRGKGRPADHSVGRDALLATAKRLIKDLPPARVTISLIAREAGVDPALVRYYFGDRSNLLMAVAESMLADSTRTELDPAKPLAAIEQVIRRTAHFTSSTKHIHRLMVDELAGAKSAAIGEHLGELNRGAVNDLDALMSAEGPTGLRHVNPAFLHLALLGLFDFFASAEPVVRQLVPQGTDMKTLAAEYEDFVVDLLLNGLRKPEPSGEG